jgi:hypothetical protein
MKMNELLVRRFKKASEKLSKMTGLAELSASGELSSFSGVFRLSQLLETEKEQLRLLLEQHRETDQEMDDDLQLLINLTSEVKAINNQAALLHGERIKRAQEILKKYKEGAFSTWLRQIYGNRQTPYNFLQYYELYTSVSQDLRSRIGEMPRQVVYTLASRSGPLEQKEAIIQNYKGESKEQLLSLIRETFPLAETDGRIGNLALLVMSQLKKVEQQMKRGPFQPTEQERKQLRTLLSSLQKMVL